MGRETPPGLVIKVTYYSRPGLGAVVVVLVNHFFKHRGWGIVMVFVLRAQGYGMCPWGKGAEGEGVSVS